jgi:alcohol dehydrogenase
VTSGQANPMSDTLGEKAVSLVCKYLPRAVKNGSDIEARTNMSFAAMSAGYAFNDAITHIGHSIGHTLGAMFHIPHGNACAVAIPEIMEFVAEGAPAGIKRLGMAMGLKIDDNVTPQEAGVMVRDAIRALNKEIGIKTLKQLNIKESSLPEIATRGTTEGPAMFSPRKVTSDDILNILQKAYNQ